MTTLKVGIANREAFKKRTLAIARGEHKASAKEPKVWFESIETLSQVLSEPNRKLLALIMETQPRSLAELAARSGRAPSNLSRTLRNMERYGLIAFEEGRNRQRAPVVRYSGVELEL